jgi:hypothetical protein
METEEEQSTLMASVNRDPVVPQRKREQGPNVLRYWPADRVPYTPFSYCQVIQWVFAAMFLSILSYIIFFLK